MSIKEKIQDLENKIKIEIDNIFNNQENYLEFLKIRSFLTIDNIENAVLLYGQNKDINLINTSQSFFKSNIPVRVNEKGYNQLINVERKYINRDGIEIPLKQASKDEWNKIRQGDLEVITKKEKSITKVFDIKQTICSEKMTDTILNKTKVCYDKNLLKDALYSFMQTKQYNLDFKLNSCDMINQLVNGENENLKIVQNTTVVLICNYYGIEVNEDIKKNIIVELEQLKENTNRSETLEILKQSDKDYMMLKKEIDNSIIPFINTIEKSRKEINREEYER
ncbi:hypothetical protein [Anaerofustis butyriciformans]|uniref:hypothetical protein n=1 Tax=Anaerofustis butyriciformans TaxID=3108533 RepID=UPI002E2F2D6A|nr:hypothetical protein [Anaerofustis sp. HA2171]